jgi:hypothetical protein
MKTPMQELIDEMTYMLTEGERSIYALREKARKLLEKEKEQMCEFADEFSRECIDFHHAQTMSPDRFFELTFNTKER